MTSLPFLAGKASAAVITWTGAVDANWSTATAPTNWTPNAPAISGDSLVFDDSGANTTNTDDIGSLSVAGLAFNGITNSFTLNGTAALALTGGATALVNNSSQVQTVNLPLNFGVATTFAGGASASSALKLNGAITNTAATGNIVLTLTGNGVIDDNITDASAAGTVITPNAAGTNWTIVDNPTSAAITLASGQFNIINGMINFGTATSAPNFTVTTAASDHTVGNAASNGTLNMNAGTLILKTRLNTVNGAVNINAGNLQSWNQYQQANGAVANISTTTITDGTFEVRNSTGATSGGPLFVASRGAGTLTVNGGFVLCSTLDVSRGAAAAVSGVASQGVVNLNGGTLTCNIVTTASANTNGTGAGAAGTVYFNGGVLKAKQNQAAFIRDSSGASTNIPLTLFVKSGGAIIDANAFAIGTAKPLQHDPALGATLDGGLTLIASGTPAGSLTLSGVNTYTGPTTIKSGALFLSSATVNNNIATSSAMIVGDTIANAAAAMNVTGVTTAGGFQLASGQTLGGFGTITGAVTALPGSIVGPGNSIGTLNEATSLALAGTLKIELNDADPGIVDLLNDLGNLDISAPTSAVTFNVTGTPTAPAYVFAKYGTLTGSAFGTVNNLPAGYSIDYNYQGANQIALVVPEPGLVALAATGLVGSALRRRRK